MNGITGAVAEKESSKSTSSSAETGEAEGGDGDDAASKRRFSMSFSFRGMYVSLMMCITFIYLLL